MTIDPGELSQLTLLPGNLRDESPLPSFYPASPSFTFTYNAEADLALNLMLGDATYKHNFIVEWGDGYVDQVTSSADLRRGHVYRTSGIHTVKITGYCEYFVCYPQWFFPGVEPSDPGQAARFIELVDFTGDLGFKRLSFENCYNLEKIVSFGTQNSLVDCRGLFTKNYKLAEVPADLFYGCPNVLDFDSVFAVCSLLTTIPEGVFDYCVNVTYFGYAFYGGTPITSWPANLFKYNTQVRYNGFVSAFAFCNFPSGVPSGFFDGCGLVSTLYKAFDQINSCPSIPEDLFKYMPLLSEVGYTFDLNAGNRDIFGWLTSIPAGIFKYNQELRKVGMSWYPGTEVPAELFFNNPKLNWLNFRRSGITSLPQGFFDTQFEMTSIGYCFGEAGLQTLPSGLFRWNTNITNFQNAFEGCPVTVPSDLFYYPGEEGVRFLNKNMNFYFCFVIADPSTPGVAPNLWDCDYGTGSVYKVDCFKDASAARFTNYASIPNDWKGL